MDLTPRLKQILMIMLEEGGVIPVKELAQCIGVSKRTVQRELEYIGNSLKQYQITFETKTGKGVWIGGKEEDKQKLLIELKQKDNYDVSNREERRKRLVLEILKNKGLKKLFYYASQFQVSEATISTDLEAVEGWLNEQQPTFVRLLHDMKIANPVLEDIKQSYPNIFERSKRAATVLERWMGKPIPETEVGFLTIHFGAAQVRMEGKKENIRRVMVGVVCASGIGISRLMLTKLDKIFRERIQMETYGQNDITPYVIGKIDFFVSSIALKSADADVIQVNPLLNSEDIERVRQKIFYYEQLPKKEQEETRFMMELEQVNILAMQIKTILRYIEVFKVSNDLTFEELVIAISEKISPYRDQQRMIQEDIERREKLGSQIFAEFGFGLLHTRTRGVIRPSFNVCITRDRGAFCNPYFKGIQVVLVMLLPVDDNVRVNSEILGHISSILIEDYDFLNMVIRGEKEEIRVGLSEHLRVFFNQYLNRV